jgi:hypothetical protein
MHAWRTPITQSEGAYGRLIRRLAFSGSQPSATLSIQQFFSLSSALTIKAR